MLDEEHNGCIKAKSVNPPPLSTLVSPSSDILQPKVTVMLSVPCLYPSGLSVLQINFLLPGYVFLGKLGWSLAFLCFQEASD